MPEERKLVSILFADVAGSTLLSDALDPEDVRALMGRYYAHARRLAAAHGGSVEKFIGDAVVAVFGLVHAHEDDAERALATALALRDAIAGDDVLNGSITLRMGVNTGEVITTDDPSRGDFLITGDAVNVAARLQQSAGPGEIVAGERTAEAAQRTFEFAEPREIEVKGKPQPLLVRQLLGIRAHRLVERPPLVGRRQDLMQLALLRARVLEERRSQLVTIIAPAGTGKTRLLEESLATIAPEEGFRVATARCLPYGQNITYWPLRDLLSAMLGTDIERAAVIAAFREGGYKAEDAERLADLVLATLGVEGESAPERETIFGAWRLLVEVLCLRAPRIIVFEDLHWASDSLLDLVEHITQHGANTPLLLIALSRPELTDRRPTWGGGWQNFTSIALQPLTTAQTRQLVDQLAARLPEETRARVVERAGGSPFFALELARGLTERGATTGAAPLPDTVHAAVQARLDLLSSVERAIVQVASVASRTFSADMVRHVLDDQAAALVDAALGDLLTRDVIARSDGESYAFRHILVRDVAYGALSRPERIRLHARVAAWLETSAGERVDEYAELIAYHFREALTLARQSAVPLTLPFTPERAIFYLRRAGELAGRAGARKEARAYYQSAIALAPESEQIALYEALGDSLHWGDIAYEAYHQATERWRRTNAADALMGARLIRKQVVVCTRGLVTIAPEYAEMRVWLDEARRLAEVSGLEAEQWRLRVADLFLLARLKAPLHAEADERRQAALEAAAYFEGHGDWAAFSEALDAYTAVSAKMGRFEEIVPQVERRLAVPDLPIEERADAVAMAAAARAALGDYVGCIATVRAALANLKPGEPLTLMLTAITAAYNMAHLTGRWDECDALQAPVAAVWEQVQDDSGMANLLIGTFTWMMQLALAREDRPATDAAYAALARIFPDPDSPERAILNAIRAGDPQLIEDYMASRDYRPLALGEYTMIPVMFLSEHGVAASDAIVAGKTGSAWDTDLANVIFGVREALVSADDSALATAIEALERRQMLDYSARMRLVLAERTRDPAQLERARAVFERIGDRAALRRTEEVASAIRVPSPLPVPGEQL